MIFDCFFFGKKMLVGGHGEHNPNAKYLKSRGLWLSYTIGMLVLHLILLSVPVLSVPMVWTLTNLIHNAVSAISFFLFNFCK